MLSFIASLTSLLAATAAIALPVGEARAEVAPRAGPSGYVVYPPGGTTFDSYGGAESSGGESYIHVQYEGVYQNSPYTATIGVDIFLEDPTGVQPDQYLAYNFGTPTIGLIDGYFSPPAGACGDYRLVFEEHQNLGNYGDIIKFRAAAPSITLLCLPIQ
ncbi:hypothetical protein CALVIDRAFT_567320 [Calocera viscosa TUFC12733]|uniref:Uncharacterized protein n=1 Tax=Calocera viscosa (strain TUFC12733) TaxID=1330018 RepID=A0A167IAB6_CALVF|nr:hypothetical protein CALVIDRAFT_567320 [Calocera viscosa TUFC12733]